MGVKQVKRILRTTKLGTQRIVYLKGKTINPAGQKGGRFEKNSTGKKKLSSNKGEKATRPSSLVQINDTTNIKRLYTLTKKDHKYYNNKKDIRR